MNTLELAEKMAGVSTDDLLAMIADRQDKVDDLVDANRNLESEIDQAKAEEHELRSVLRDRIRVRRRSVVEWKFRSS